MTDATQVIQDLNKSFDEFKSTNDALMSKMAKGEALSELKEKTEKIERDMERLESLQKDVDDLAKRSQRQKSQEESIESLEHKEAYSRFLIKGHEDGLGDLQVKADITTTTDASGGYAVPENVDRMIMQIERDANPLRAACNNISINVSEWKKLVSTNGAGSGWVGETAARPKTDSPQLTQVALSFGELYANPATTQKALDEMVTPVEQWLAEEVGYEFADKENLAFTSGTGTNMPKGILAYTLAATPNFGQIKQVISEAVGEFDYDDFITLESAIKAGYRNNAMLMTSRSGVTNLRKLKLDNKYLWQPSQQAGQPSTLGGYAILENEDMPAFASGANAYVFGDFRRGYTIADVFGTRVLRDPYTNKPYVGFYTTKRLGGGVVDSTALAVATIKSA